MCHVLHYCGGWLVDNWGMLYRAFILDSHSPLRLAVARVQMLVFLEPELVKLGPSLFVSIFQELARPFENIRFNFLVVFLSFRVVLIRRFGDPQVAHGLDL